MLTARRVLGRGRAFVKRPMLVLGLMALIPPIVVGAAEAVAWLLYHDEPTWDEPAPTPLSSTH